MVLVGNVRGVGPCAGKASVYGNHTGQAFDHLS